MTVADFRAWFPGGQFSALTDAYVNAFITRASVYVDDANAWGARYAEALFNCAAHMIVVDKTEAGLPIDQIDADDGVMDSIGPIRTQKSEKVVEMMAEDQFKRTTYGRRYVAIRDLIGLGGVACADTSSFDLLVTP